MKSRQSRDQARRKRERNPNTVPGHLQWVRARPCLVEDAGGCGGKVRAHHVRKGYPEGTPASEKGGTSKLPHDKWAVPLCDGHHTDGPKAAHRMGHDSFQREFDVHLTREAAKLWRHDALHRMKHERSTG